MRWIYRILVAALLLLPVNGSWAADFVLITNPANPAAVLSAQDAKNIFLGKKTLWENGQQIKVFTQQHSAVTDSFTRDIVKKSAQQYFIYWRKALFTGTGTPPVDVQNDQEMKEFVRTQPGAIGYIASVALDGSVKRIDVR